MDSTEPQDETTPPPASVIPPKPPASPAARTPEPIAAISGLGITGGLGIIVGVILIFVANNVGSSYDMSVSDLAARIATASFAGVAFTVGVICAVAAGVLAGIREMLRRYRSGGPI